MPALVLTLLIVIIEMNMKSITNLSIGFANIGNIDTLVNNIIKSIQLLITMCNWHRKSMDINKRMVKSRNNNALLYTYTMMNVIKCQCANQIGVV